MTTLAPGVTTFAAASWSDTTGFQAAAQLEVGVRARIITGGLSQGGSGSIESLIFHPGANMQVGSADDGPLVVDCANSTDAKVQNLGEVDLRIEAAGASKVENIHTSNPRARTRLLGGEFETTSIAAGRLTANESTLIDDFYGLGGKSILGYYGTAITGDCDLVNGVHTLKRRANLIRVGMGATLILDHDPQITSWGTDEIQLFGGTVIWLRGVLPKITGIGGTLDFRAARESIGSALGTTTFDVAGTKILARDDIDLSNLTVLGAIARGNGDLVEYGGAIAPPAVSI